MEGGRLGLWIVKGVLDKASQTTTSMGLVFEEAPGKRKAPQTAYGLDLAVSSGLIPSLPHF